MYIVSYFLSLIVTYGQYSSVQSRETNKPGDELVFGRSKPGTSKQYSCQSPIAELSFVTLTIHLCNGLNDKNLVKPRKTRFLSL